MTAIPFGNWQPDLPAKNNPGALLVKNCLPFGPNSYKPLRALSPLSDALAMEVRGSYWAIFNGVKYNFAADSESLYLFDNAGSYDDVSKPATTYSADTWEFVTFLNRVIATDGGSGPLQYFDMGVSSTFDDLPGNPPIATSIAVVRDFIVLGNYQYLTETEPGGFAWSGFNNSGLWDFRLSSQSGRRPSRGEGGDVKRIIGGSQGLFFREGAIGLMRYIGSPNVWQWDDVTTLHGTPARRSVSWSKDFAWYYSQEGFQQINRRTMEITPVGHDAVDEWFKLECAPAEVVFMISACDRARNLVWWAFRSSSSSVPFNRVLVYNYLNKRWAYAEIEVEWLGEFVSAGFNLDTIGAVLGGNIDSESINVDTDLYSGGSLSFIGFDPAHTAGNFGGDALTAEIDTTEFTPGDSRKRAFVNGVIPDIEGTSATTVQAAPITRNLLTDNPVLGTFRNQNQETGQVDIRVNARHMRYRVKIAGGFDHATGINLAAKMRGKR